MNETSVIITIIVGLVGMVVYQRNKTKSAEALLENQETKEKLNELNKDIIKNKALMEVEEEKRKIINDEVTKKKTETLSLEAISDFFNKLNNIK